MEFAQIFGGALAYVAFYVTIILVDIRWTCDKMGLDIGELRGKMAKVQGIWVDLASIAPDDLYIKLIRRTITMFCLPLMVIWVWFMECEPFYKISLEETDRTMTRLQNVANKYVSEKW